MGANGSTGGRRIRVGLIFGGKSGEHEVSLASAQSVARAINRDKYDIALIGITKDGCWISGDHALKELAAASPSPLLLPNGDPTSSDSPEHRVIDSWELVPQDAHSLAPVSPLAAIDVAFPLVHGPFGEDGTIQGLLELADIPYVGAGVAASAVGMDKALMKAVFQAHGLPIVDWVVVLRREWEMNPDGVIQQIEKAFGYPCFIKPANLGSSVGVSKAHNAAEVREGLALAAQYDRKLIAERSAEGCREIECSVLGNDEPIASIPGEILPKREFYDYAAKYEKDSGTELVVPADLSPATTGQLQEMAVKAFRAIDASGMARVDFFVERGTDRIILNEINTIPGFTAVSMYPKMWDKTGLSYSDIIDRLIRLALERQADKRKNKTSYGS